MGNDEEEKLKLPRLEVYTASPSFAALVHSNGATVSPKSVSPPSAASRSRQVSFVGDSSSRGAETFSIPVLHDGGAGGSESSRLSQDVGTASPSFAALLRPMRTTIGNSDSAALPRTSLRHMSTMEIMSAAVRLDQYDKQARASVATSIREETDENDDDDSLEMVRIPMPARQPWKRAWIRCQIVGEELKPVMKRNFPSTLNQNRVGLQLTIVLLLSSFPLYIKFMADFLQGSAVFIVISAVLMYEGTYGGTFRKGLDRGLACILAYGIALPVFLPVHLSGHKSLSENFWLRWLFVSSAVGCTYFWCFLRFHYGGNHQPMVYAGVSTSLSFYAMVYEDWFNSMWRTVVGTLAGIVIGTLVFRYVIPRSARDCAQTDMVHILRHIGQTLEPLIEFESGLVKSKSFFAEKAEHRHKPMRLLSKTLSKTIGLGRASSASRGGARFRLSSMLSMRRSTATSNHEDRTFEQQEIDYEIFKQFRDRLWRKIEDTYRLLNQQKNMSDSAKREYSGHVPHLFPIREYETLVKSVKELFFCVTSLYLVLDTQTVAAQADADSFREVLGDNWDWCGTVKIKRQETAPEVSQELRQIKSHPAQIGLLLHRSRAELASLRNKFASDPRLRDPGPTMGEPPPIVSPPIGVAQEEPIALQPTLSARRFGSLLVPKRDELSPRPRGIDSVPAVTPTPTATAGPEPLSFQHGKSLMLPGEAAPPMGFVSQSTMAVLQNGAKPSGTSVSQLHEMAPILKWVTIYGPLIGRVSRHIFHAIELMATSMERQRQTTALQQTLNRAEAAIGEFSKHRRDWQLTVQQLFDEYLVKDIEHTLELEQQRVSDALLKRWMGIALPDYLALSPCARAQLWDSFGAMQDRLATTLASLLSLTVQLHRVSTGLQTFMTAMHYPLDTPSTTTAAAAAAPENSTTTLGTK